MKQELAAIRQQFVSDIAIASSADGLREIEIRYLGRKSGLAMLTKKLPEFLPQERAQSGEALNTLKAFLQDELEKKRLALKTHGMNSARIDVSLPGKRLSKGHPHPLTLVIEELADIFSSLNFLVIEGPEVETEFYNFDALNIPKDHPARDMWDTFWLKTRIDADDNADRRGYISVNPRIDQRESALLLRTHTSPMQIRFMETHEPPLRIVVPGKTFRYEASDATHESEFHQLEGLFVDKEVSVANFKAVIELFLKRIFGKDFGGIRLRPSYFPFVEPGFEVFMYWKKKEKWLEIMGAGMVHQNVFQAAGFMPNEWQGFAFGLGVDRVAMLKYGIPDIRMFYNGDLRVINQF